MQQRNSHLAAIAAIATLAAGPVAPALAQNYPTKSIRLIVAQSAGSATDVAARVIATPLSALLKQQVVVDNRAGAGGLLGTELAARAPADGYTLIFANISTHGVNPALYRKLPYDAIRDFTPIAMACTTPNVLVVNASLPAKTAAELIALIRSRPGQLNVATPGSGSSQHLAVELFMTMAGGLKSQHVPYKGSGPAMTALIAGEASWMIPTLTLSLPHIRSGKIRALGVTSTAPHEDLPQVPPLADTLPGYEVLSWYGFAAPARTPAAIVSQLNKAAATVLAMPETRKGLAAAGMSVQHSTPAQFGEFIRSEIEKWTKVARGAGITLD
jgi:tripartite-type tricarboxylate transporter receptor subunit TctC